MAPVVASMTVDDAVSYMVDTLRTRKASQQHGYDLVLKDVVDKYVIEREHISRDGTGYRFRDRGSELSPFFLTAAWELARRGVLRPGLGRLTDSGTGNNVFGAGYSVTAYGEVWLRRADYEQLASVIPGRFVELLATHQKPFGQAYLVRGTEAVHCYNAHAFLACCVMCGAGAESVMLALALERMPEADVWKTYESAGGRGKLVTRLVGQSPDHVKREFQGFTALLQYWRDESAHGRLSAISEVEAFTSLMLLLRFSRYVDDVFPS